ncbi:thiamine-phosphate synthase 1 [Halobacillus andaensis]|uniref:Thiamine-phosphate synthase n=1 Tax=Halobacillus andaensis TaxID=1176239 RepID=A0A917EVC1_HALAA|nr:thiamine phosphate synthase [Halobacillus andaensis]MBP2004669.1 thiamine-phosphate pyrophosphorylase [Halobacillus andaensis]GGF19848.1 thiamine-phosphate synthase 1 [Halobacillus andaensis]
MDLSKKLRKYLIMGSQNCPRDPIEILKEAIYGGITAFQYREKGPGSLEGEAKLELGKKFRELCRKYNVLFIVNDDSALVEPLDADGIHVGQDDVDVEELRTLFPEKLIGLSISNEEELLGSSIEAVDYLGAGPVFDTSTKVDAKEAVGVGWIERVKRLHPEVPLVGIGGITVENASEVIEAGADGVSVISAITDAEDVPKAVEKL